MSECKNCGGRVVYDRELWNEAKGFGRQCADCGWPEGKPVPDEPLCSVCRRRHGPEVKHECE